eukprot:g80299.t1
MWKDGPRRPRSGSVTVKLISLRRNGGMSDNESKWRAETIVSRGTGAKKVNRTRTVTQPDMYFQVLNYIAQHPFIALSIPVKFQIH